MIQVNDLVYKLEPDISVAVNRTHKNHFFQQSEYKSTQTSIAILNSGADYIDCRRSFLHFQVDLTCAPHQITQWNPWHTGGTAHVTAWARSAAQNRNDNKIINGYFGPNGSILNLIDTVTVATRSGDELSRVQNVALLANTTLPLIYGDDWKKTVGAMIGFGDCVYGKSAKRDHPYASRRYSIPLYLLSPLFQYGRLMPSMLMSGLKITITWKTAAKAFAQFVSHVPKAILNTGGYVRGLGVNQGSCIPFIPDDLNHIVPSTEATDTQILIPDVDLDELPQSPDWTRLEAIDNAGSMLNGPQKLQYAMTVPTDGPRPDAMGAYYGDKDPVNVFGVDSLTFVNDGSECNPDFWGTGVDERVHLPVELVGRGGILIPGFKRGPPLGKQPFRSGVITNTSPAAGLLHGYAIAQYEQNPPFIEEYTIKTPEFSLCSIQLSDAIQRTLNEYSAVNGLEIVYTDYDLTCAPIDASVDGTSVYTEVRKSASRALQAFARITPDYSATVERTSDSNAATVQYFEDMGDRARGWIDYQWQLGSLYFPQQKVQSRDYMDMATLAYSYTLEAFDRMSGSVSCMLRLQDSSDTPERQKVYLDRTLAHRNPMATQYAGAPDVLSQERLYIKGKPGSFCGGGEVIAVSLERSSLFNLSGIPINNSRVLALRGNYSMVQTNYCKRHTLNIFLKYVKLARIFLNNVEVEQ